MKSLSQERAKSAWKLKGKEIRGQGGGEVIKKIPAMLIQNGLMATLGMAQEPKNEGFYEVLDYGTKHCKNQGIVQADKPDELYKELQEGDSALLRAVTREMMAWLSYARRVPLAPKVTTRG